MDLAVNKQLIRPISGRIVVIRDQSSPKSLAQNTDCEALQMAKKLLEYARYKRNENLSLVLPKSTDLLQEILIRNHAETIFTLPLL